EAERNRGSELQASLTIEPHLAHGGRALEWTRQLNLLRVCRGRHRKDRRADADCRHECLEETHVRRPHVRSHLGNRYSQLKGKNMLTPIWAWTLFVRRFSPNQVFALAGEFGSLGFDAEPVAICRFSSDSL